MGMWSTIYGSGSKDAASGSGGPGGSASSRESLAQMQERLDTLVLINMAMWSFIRQNSNLTEEDLMDKVREIDLMDGVEDGKVTKHVAKCTQCERVMSPRHKRCVYCGAQRLDATAFDSV